LARAKASAFTAPGIGADAGVAKRALRPEGPAMVQRVVWVCVLVIEIVLPEVGLKSSLTDWVNQRKRIK
jgi:hypothetical protein